MPDDGSAYEAPSFEPIDELDAIVVRARADQFPVIEQLLAVVDEEAPSGTEFRVVRLRTPDPVATADRAAELFETLGQNLEPDERGTVSYSFDEATGNLLITADSVGMQRYTALLNQAQQLSPPQRSTRLLDLREARAADVLTQLRGLLAQSPASDPGREVPDPDFAVVEKTNSILVTAEDVQHQVIAEYVRRLDVLEPTDLPPLRLLQVRSADAAAIARMLSDQYNKRPQSERRDEPVDIRSDTATNTLIVSAHENVLPDIERFVENLNAADTEDADRETQIFPLKVARAADLASAMQRLYPDPPMPRDRRGRPMPWLQEPREVNVSADAASNALIVDAPAERMAAFAALVDKLDRVELPPQATLRTYAIERGDLTAIANTLRQLANAGSLNAPAQPGKQRVPVTIESEPRSGTLIVGGDEVTHEIVERLLSDLSMVPVERELRVVRIENADPRSVAQRASEVYQQQIAEIPGAQPVDVSVDESTNALLVVAEAEAMSRYMRILDQLEQQAGPPRELRLYELQHASAETVIAFLNELVASSAPFSAGSVVDPVFEPIDRSNSVLVAALGPQHAIIRSLIESVDVPEGAEAGPLRILRLRTAEATNIERVLSQAFAQRPPEERAAKPVSIRADEATNSLIVSAHPDVLPEIEQLVSDLNDAQSYDAEGREIRIFPLKVARAEELARTIDAMFPAPPVPLDRRGRPMFNLQQPKEVQVRADPQTNSLIVDAPAKRLAGFEQLVTQLDRAEITGEADLRTYTVTRADLESVRGALQRLAQSGGLTAGMSSNRLPIVIEAELLTSTLIVSAPPESFERIESVIDELEGSRTAAASQLLFFTLENARADRLSEMVGRVLRSRYDALADAGELPTGRGERMVEVTADTGTNTLVVSVPEPLAETAREIVARLDAGAVRVGRDVVRVVPLSYADAEAAAPALQRTLDSAELPSGGGVTVSASRGTDALIVSGSETDVAFVEELIADLDAPPADESIGARTVFLEHNRAEVVARVVEQVLAGERMNEWIRFQLLRSRIETGEDEMIRVAAEPGMNAIVVTGPRAMLPVAEELINELDRPGGESKPARPVRVLTLESADAASVAQNLEAVFAEDGASADAPPLVRTDAEANALIVRGTTSQLDEIERLAERLDNASLAGTRELRTLRVDRSRTNAAALAETLRRLLEDRGVPVEVIDADELLGRQGGRSPRSDAGGSQSGGDGDGARSDAAGGAESGEQEHKDAAGGILLPKNLRFILKGFRQTVIAQAGAGGAGEQAVDDDDAPEPVDIAALVQEAQRLLEQERTNSADEGSEEAGASGGSSSVSGAGGGAEEASGSPAAASQSAAGRGRAADASDADDDAGDDEATPGVTLAVDPETNRLVVVGSSRATERIARLAEELQNQLPPEPTTIRVVRLPDETDANTVTNLVRATVGQLGRASETNPSGMTGNVVILPDRAGQSVIVASNDTDFETVSSLIGALATPGETARLTIRAYPLTSVQADRAVRAIEDLLSTQTRGRQAGRLRAGQPLELTVADDEGVERTVTIEAGSVNVVAGPANASVIVAGPSEAFPAITRFVELLDQSPSASSGLTRVYELEYADAQGTARTLQSVFNAGRARNRGQSAAASVLADDRTNTLVVTASDDEHAEVQRLLAELDRSLEEDQGEVVVIPVQSGTPSALARAIDEVVIGRDEAKRESVTVRPDDALNVLLVRAPEEELAEIRGLLEELDRPDVAELPVRSLKLENADAGVVAAALSRFFDDRARASTNPGQRAKQSRVAISGDRATGTLVVAASDADWEEVQRLVETFDAPGGAAELQFNVIQLENARVSDIIDTAQSLAFELQWMQTPWFRGGGGGQSDMITLEADRRNNRIIVLGSGDSFDTIERIVRLLDAPKPASAALVARAFKVERGDLRVLVNAVQQAVGDPGASRRWWEPPDPTALVLQVDDAARVILAIGPEDKVQEAGAMIERLASSLDTAEQGIESVELSFADAGLVADNVNRFFQDRARNAGARTPAVTAIGTRGSSVVILSGSSDELALAADIAARFDEPDAGTENRTVEVFALAHADPRDIARSVAQLFPRSRTTGRTPVVASPDVRTGSLVVSAPDDLVAEVTALVKRLDQPTGGDDVTLRSFPLETARADEVARTLQQTLNLDGQGRPLRGPSGEIRRFLNDAGEPIEVAAVITPDRRSNTLLISADAASMSLIENLIEELDDQPAQSPTEYRIFRLEHAVASDVSTLVSRLLNNRARAAGEPTPSVSPDREENTLIVSATPDQLAEAERILAEIDVPPAREQTTEFVKLEFADATQVRSALSVFFGRFAPAAKTPGARNVQITADPATNSLVISAEASEWENINELIAQLDNEQYDPSRRLEVIPLRHADAASVAQAVQAAFDKPLQAELQAEQRRSAERERRSRDPFFSDFFDAPAVLIEADDVVAVSAEPFTNSLIVSAGQRDLERIRSIVSTLDVPGFANLPAPTIIPLDSGKAEEVAQTLRELYESSAGGRRGASSRRSIAIVADAGSNALIVRAPDEEIGEIVSIAQSLQRGAEASGVSVRTLRLSGQPATRLAETLRESFAPQAQRENETFTVQADARTNTLVITSSKRLFDEIERVVRELDPAGVVAPASGGEGAAGGGGEEVPAPAINQEMAIFDLEHIAPGEAVALLERIGVTSPQPLDRPGLVGEPVRVVPLGTRAAIAVLVQPADRDAIASLIETLDTPPVTPGQTVEIVPLRTAEAGRVAQAIERMLNPAQNDAQTAIAGAISEQIRRLRMRGEGVAGENVNLDLTVPIRIDAEDNSNSIIVASTPGNVAALRTLIEMLDRLPVGDAVIVRIFHLSNASSDSLASIVRELFQQGEAIRRAPGTNLQGLPTTEVGRALAGEVAVAIDERTNALIVAGREEAVALAEVLVTQLDATESANWIEPRIVPLEHADARTLSETLNEVIVRGLGDTPDTIGLQRQIARLRVAQRGGGGAAAGLLEADLFAPLTRLLIIPEESLNALIMVGGTPNLDAVEALIGQLDVEAASRDQLVRVYPLNHAAADRVGDLLQGLFAQQVRNDTLREADALTVEADTRTNALIVATSPRSFEVVERLLETLDTSDLNPTVGISVIPVEGADAGDLAPRIESLMRERLRANAAGSPSARDVVSVQAAESANALIVAASAENLAVIEELVTLLSEQSGTMGGGGVEIIPLESASADQMVDMLDELYVRQTNRTRGEANAVRVRADERLNAVIVSGSPADVEKIRTLIADLDKQQISAVREIKVVPLSSANALEMVNLINNIISGRGGRASDQATLLRFYSELLDGRKRMTEAEISTALRTQVSLEPELRTNAVIVTAPPSLMVLIEALISDIDSSAEGARTIEVFQLENADAEAMRDLLVELFNLRQQGSLFVLVPSGPDS
jgi:type II secretory pathway component GspD/PulD (secretin)